MRQASRTAILAAVALALLFTGCDTFSYVPIKSPTVVQPQGAEGSAAGAQPGQAPGEPVSASPASQPPQPRADLNQQVEALEARVQVLEKRLAELERPQPAPKPAPGGPPPARPGAATQPAAKAAAPAAEKSYAEGLHLYQSKKYGPARDKFAQSLKDQPQGPKAQEARYYLADSFYQEGKYREAAVEFHKLASQFPRSILAPAALLRQALSYKNQQQTQNYQSTLKKLVKAYPQSPEAKEAQKWLKEGAR
jgi:tol-pal system protein YbgF